MVVIAHLSCARYWASRFLGYFIYPPNFMGRVILVFPLHKQGLTGAERDSVTWPESQN